MKIRKNDKAYLQDLKIDIRSDNDIYFQELALLLDKQRFLDLLPSIRQTYKIVKLFPLEDFEQEVDAYERDCFSENTKVKIDLSKYTKTKEVKESFPEFYDFIKTSNVLPETLEAECDLICYEFNRPPYFLEPVKQAIYCGAVNDSFFQPTQATTVDFSVMGAWPTLERIAIFVSPTSTYEDVEEEFRKAKEMMKTDKRLSYYKPRTDTVPNIRKYRHWYWEQIKNKTLELIANEWADKHQDQEDNTTYIEVLKGIKTYKRLLAS